MFGAQVHDQPLATKNENLLARTTSLEKYNNGTHDQYAADINGVIAETLKLHPNLNSEEALSFLDDEAEDLKDKRSMVLTDPVVVHLKKALLNGDGTDAAAGDQEDDASSRGAKPKAKAGKGKAAKEKVVKGKGKGKTSNEKEKASTKSSASSRAPQRAETQSWDDERALDMDVELDDIIRKINIGLQVFSGQKSKVVERLTKEVDMMTSSIPEHLIGSAYKNTAEHTITGNINMNPSSEEIKFTGAHIFLDGPGGQLFPIVINKTGQMERATLGQNIPQEHYQVTIDSISPKDRDDALLEGVPIRTVFVSGSYIDNADEQKRVVPFGGKRSTSFICRNVSDVRKVLIFIKDSLSYPTPAELAQATGRRLNILTAITSDVSVEARWYKDWKNKVPIWTLSTFFPNATPGVAKGTREVLPL